MDKKGTINILFCGRGGQGVLTASEVCGWAAVFEGFHVKKSEVHGMAQRGGSVESHLRFGKEIFSPLIPEAKADFLIPFDKQEWQRHKGFLRNGGVCLSPEQTRADIVIVDRKRYLNIFLLGVLSRYLPIKEKNWMSAIETVFASRNMEENKKIFQKGRLFEMPALSEKGVDL